MYNIDAANDETSYLSKVYGLLTLGLGITMTTAYLAVTQGATVPVETKHGPMLVTPAVSLAVEHPLMLSLIFLALAVVAAVVRKIKGIGFLVFAVFTVVSGLLIGPAIAYAEFKASQGLGLSMHPVRDAGLLTTAAFVGLSAYTLASKRDFSYMGGFLFSGLIVLIGAGILNLFLGSSVLGVATAGVGVILFLGFILYDTSNILRGNRDDAVGDALNLYLDVLNIFLDILRLFGSKD